MGVACSEQETSLRIQFTFRTAGEQEALLPNDLNETESFAMGYYAGVEGRF